MLNIIDDSTCHNLALKLGPAEHLTLGDLIEGLKKLRTILNTKINSDPNRDVDTLNTLWFRIPSGRKATDLRDLIYGMLNLLPKTLMSLIRVDYSRENKFVDAIAEFAQAHIKSTNCL
jgi:hypothetical protein